MTEETYARFIGTGGFEEFLTETYGLPPDFLAARILPAYHDRLARGLDALDGAGALIEAARTRGLRLAVASMSGHASIERTLRAAGLRHHFPLVVSASDVARGKPAPDIYLHAARLLDIPPGACIAVEDSVHGILAAAAAGMRVVQSRQATFVPPPHPSAHTVIETLEAFDHGWFDGERMR